MLSRRSLGICILTFVFALPMGCREREEIRTYAIPPLAEKPQVITEATPDYRLWGLIIPVTEGQSVFFKAQGLSSTLTAADAELEQFSKSIAFPNGKDKNPTWTLPAGWTEDRANPNRIATINVVKGDQKFQLAVTKFGGNIIDNANRWRGMVGLDPIKESDISKVAPSFKTASGVEVFKVDVQGPKNPDAGGMPGMRMGGMPSK